MYGLCCREIPTHSFNIITDLERRLSKSVEDALGLVAAFEMTYRRFGFESLKNDRQDNAYYLEVVSVTGVRNYA